MIVLIKKKTLMFISLAIIILFIFSISFGVLLTVTTSDTASPQDNSKKGVAVPIIMYHSLMKTSREMGKYVITPTEFENDLKYLKDHGYESITMTELINYVHNGGTLPEKPVIITFDDGNLNNYLYGYSILQKYQMKAIVSIIGSYSEAFSTNPYPTNDPRYAHASWDQIKEMHDSGCFEIQNHSYNLHFINKRNGAKRKKGEPLETYKKILTADIMKLQQKLTESTGVTPNTFVYPFGSISKESVDILKEMGFKATLSCNEGVNYIDKNKEDILFGLKRKNRPHGISSSSFFKNFCP